MTLLMKISKTEKILKDIMIYMIFPYLIIAMITAVPTVNGVAIMTGEIEPFVIEEPMRTEISEFFLIIIPLFVYYSASYSVIFLIWASLTAIRITFEEKKAK